jgi:hypothetical protein
VNRNGGWYWMVGLVLYAVLVYGPIVFWTAK